jgi:hypothetical protein
LRVHICAVQIHLSSTLVDHLDCLFNSVFEYSECTWISHHHATQFVYLRSIYLCANHIFITNPLNLCFLRYHSLSWWLWVLRFRRRQGLFHGKTKDRNRCFFEIIRSFSSIDEWLVIHCILLELLNYSNRKRHHIWCKSKIQWDN